MYSSLNRDLSVNKRSHEKRHNQHRSSHVNCPLGFIMESVESALMGPQTSHDERIQYEMSEAVSAARRWIPLSGTPNPIIQALQKRNGKEEQGWLRAAEFGKDRIGRNNNAQEKEYIHNLYSPVSRDYSCRLEFVKQLSIAWKYGKESLYPLLETNDEKKSDKCMGEEVEKILLECNSWTSQTDTENPFLFFLEDTNKTEGKGWLRAALFGRDRVGKNQTPEESTCLSKMYSRARLPKKPKGYFNDFADALSYAWGISKGRLKERLKQKKEDKSE